MGYLLTFDSARRWNKGDESSSRRIYSILAPRPRKCHIFINISNRSNRFPRGGGVVASASQRFAFAFVSRLDEGGRGEEMKEDTRLEFIRV